MDDVFSVMAPVATMLAAIMTAANLGARITGWGFVVFSIGSLAWCTVAMSTGQQNLLLTNGFLAIVNAVGAWRWLGRNASRDTGADAAERKSENAAVPTLIAVSNLVDGKVVDRTGQPVGTVAGVMAETASGTIAYAVVSIGGVGGIGARLITIDWANLTIENDMLQTSCSASDIASRPSVDPRDWPVAAN